jgi:Fuc2NAc and GlcNAc transferase
MNMTLLIFALCFASAILLTWLIRAHALRKSILDIPNDRSSHTIPTPRGGGLAIVISFFLGLIALAYYQNLPHPLLYALLCGGSLIAAIGYIDDRFAISAIIRFEVHILAAIVAFYYIGDFNIVVHGWPLGLWALPLAVLGTVWFTNLYNFMDGIDGLASLQGIFVSLAVAGALAYQGDMAIASVCILLATAIAGFLCWNWPPARIFMGDVCSGTLGFMFAVLLLFTVQTQSLSLAFWFTIMAAFICDATFTLLRRMIQGEKWYSAHRSHAYQRLVQRGYSHKQVSIGILLFNLCVLLPLAYLALWKPFFAPALAGITLIICAYLWYRICYVTE